MVVPTAGVVPGAVVDGRGPMNERISVLMILSHDPSVIFLNQ